MRVIDTTAAGLQASLERREGLHILARNGVPFERTRRGLAVPTAAALGSVVEFAGPERAP